MAEIKCPKCGEIIKLDKSSYDALLSDIEKEELNKRAEAQAKQLEEIYKTKYELNATKLQNSQETTILNLKNEIKVLEERLSNSDTNAKLEVAKALENEKNKSNEKDKELERLKGQLDNVKKDKELNEANLKQQFEFEKKALQEEIERYKNFRMGDSTKDLGESLEQYCQDSFNKIRSFAYPNAYFSKDNEIDEEGKGDFIFRDYTDDKTEIVSIMFEMKNQKDTTATKKKNEHFFDKLNKNRNSKNCEYAVLVSTLEEDSDLYNSGIVDVSYQYPKMYVVRPQNFIAIIGLIKNMAKNNLEYKKQVIAYQKENLDITNFESAVRAIAEKINTDYEKASNIYAEVDEMCDGIIKKVETFRKEFKTATGWIEKAKNQLPNLEVRKLTRNNQTMAEKFANLESDKEKE